MLDEGPEITTKGFFLGGGRPTETQTRRLQCSRLACVTISSFHDKSAPAMRPAQKTTLVNIVKDSLSMVPQAQQHLHINRHLDRFSRF